MTLKIPVYEPRPYQIPFHAAMDDGCKRVCLVWHRRAGKEMACLNELVKRAYFHRVGSYVYFFPTTTLGRRILWDGMDKQGKKFLDYIPKEIREGQPNNLEMKVKLKNGSTIQVMGTNNIINVGINPIGCVFSEFSLQDSKTWNFVRPILRENGGWAIMNFTPRGRNHAYDLKLMAQNNPNWFCQVLTVNDTTKNDGSPVITQADLDEERREGMSEHLIQQEYFCNFDLGIEGSYYAKYLNQAMLEGRVTKVSYDPFAPVMTFWDLGVGDETVILFVQQVGQEVHLIDMYRNQGEGLNHYANVLQQKARDGEWTYGDHYAPHDIQVRELGSGAQTRKDIARELGINFMIVPNLPIAEGIELGRGLFPKLWIDEEKCNFFVKAIENYHKAFNEAHNVYSDRPVHDWSSHTADSYRYMSIVLNRHRLGSMSESDADRMEELYARKFV